MVVASSPSSPPSALPSAESPFVEEPPHPGTTKMTTVIAAAASTPSRCAVFAIMRVSHSSTAEALSSYRVRYRGPMATDGFRALVESAPDAIVVSRNGVVLYANAAAARLLGHDDVSEIVGRPMTFLDRRSGEVMQRRIQQMAATGER